MAKVVSDIEKHTYQFLANIFFYMWPYPVKWDRKFTQLKLLEPFKRRIPFSISIGILSGFGVMSCVTSIFLLKITDKNLFECAMPMVIGIVVLTTSSVVYICYKEFSDILSAFNGFLKLAHKMEKGMQNGLFSKTFNINICASY